MAYRFALCDDVAVELDFLQQVVQKWGQDNGYTVDIRCFPSAEAFLFHYSEDKAVDILLLDIEMGAMNGVELAKVVRAQNQDVQIVFVTGYMDYISDGYEVEALHYLLKPVTEDKIFRVLDRAVVKLCRNEQALTLQLGDESVRLPLRDIRFLEVQRNYVTVHAKVDYTVKATLSELEKDLDSGFFRAGRSFIVNLKCIRRVTKGDIFLADGTSIPLPRGVYDAIHRAMIERL